MQEQSIMEIVKWFIFVILIMLIMSVGIFIFRLQDVNHYKQKVNQQIERKGGLTDEAIEVINEYASENLAGEYQLEGDQLNEHVRFGEPVEYQIKVTYPIEIFEIPDVTLTFSGSSVSQVR